MTDQPTNEVTSLPFVLEQFHLDTNAELVAALRVREDQMRDLLFLGGQQYGLFPQIVAEVLAQVGLGTPHTPEERTMIRDNYNNLMRQIEQAQRGQGPMPQP